MTGSQLETYAHAAPDEIIFGANMTTLAFHLSRALGRQWPQGDELAFRHYVQRP